MFELFFFITFFAAEEKVILYFVSVFRQGDTGKCWYAVLAGALEVRINNPETDMKVSFDTLVCITYIRKLTKIYNQ